MSQSWSGGSSRAWRKVRRFVLERDGYRCQVPTEAGQPCLEHATHVDHVVPRSQGGAFLDPANLRAACQACNLTRGSARPRRPQRSWSW